MRLCVLAVKKSLNQKKQIMRIIKLTVLLLLCAGWSYGQHTFTIAGGNLDISANTSLVLKDTDWKNNSGSETIGAGSVLFTGSAADISIGGTTATQFSMLLIDNSNDVFAEQNLTVLQELEFQNGKLDLQNANLILEGTVTNLNPDRYVKTSGPGVVIRELASGAEYLFPVGNSSYNPLVLQYPSGGPGQFAVRVADAVLSDGNSGAPLTANAVGRSWHVGGSGGEYPDLLVRAGWSSPDELSGFDRNAAYVARYTGSWDLLVASTASGSDPYSLDRMGGSVPAIYAVLNGDFTPPSALCQDITVELDAGGMASITPMQIDDGSSDENGIASYALDIEDFDCADLGSNIVTLTVTDVMGNSAGCTATVFVEDNTPPVVTAELILIEDQTFEVQFDATDNCDPDPELEAVMEIPDLTQPEITFKTKGKKKIQIDLTENTVKVEAPDPVAFWAEVSAVGGVAVFAGQEIELETGPQHKYQFNFHNNGDLKTLTGPAPVLRVTATDASGNSATATAEPEFPESITGGSGTTAKLSKKANPVGRNSNLTDPTAIGQLAVFPNPFTTGTTIQFELSQAGKVQLEVFDLEGRKVCVLQTAVLEAGAYSVNWDGRSGSGHELPPGNYLVRLTAGDVIKLKQVVLGR